MQPTSTYNVSLDRSFYSASAPFCYIQIHAEMAEESQVERSSFYIHLCTYTYDGLFLILSLYSLILLIFYYTLIGGDNLTLELIYGHSFTRRLDF